MTQTPEGKVKDAVKAVLGKYGVFYSMPVQTGYGSCMLDFHPCFLRGVGFCIETKAPGGRLTPRQANVIELLHAQQIRTFVIRDAVTLNDLRLFLEAIP